MKFVIKNKEGKGYFSTDYESCVPVSKIDSLNAAGYQFYLDGKKISASSLKSKFANVVPPTVYEYSSDPVQESDITVHMYGDKRDKYPTSVYSTTTMGQKSNEEDAHTPNLSSPTIIESTTTEDTEVIVDDFNIDLSSVGFAINSRTIVCLNNGKVYKTQKDAGEDLNIDPANISYSITSGKAYKGYTFKKALEFMK